MFITLTCIGLLLGLYLLTFLILGKNRKHFYYLILSIVIWSIITLFLLHLIKTDESINLTLIKGFYVANIIQWIFAAIASIVLLIRCLRRKSKS